MTDRTHVIGNLKIESRADMLDAEQVREFEGSRAWELVRRKMGEMIAAEQRTLEQAPTHEELLKAQGSVKALRRVLELPAILRDEAKPGKKLTPGGE
jgi:hypothetical protein